jgi:hypothetical protein
VLQVAVHHDRPLPARRPETEEHGAAESADAIRLGAVQEAHRPVGPLGDGADPVRRLVGAVVHEEDLDVGRAQGGVQPLDED